MLLFEVSDGWHLRARLWRARKSDAYLAPYVGPLPLVSVCVATYNRSGLLLDRCLPSILNQDYPHIEVVVVGDGCTDDTAERISSLDNPLIRFENLPKRGKYPLKPNLRWLVAGTAAMNRALEIARGDIITHLDDDDEYMPGRVTALVDHFRRERAELVWHPFHREMDDGSWALNPAATFASGNLTTSSILYHAWYKRILWDPKAYVFRQPGDWNRLSKIGKLGCRLSRYNEPLLRHYRQRSQWSR